jgi:hypothetical protein
MLLAIDGAVVAGVAWPAPVIGEIEKVYLRVGGQLISVESCLPLIKNELRKLNQRGGATAHGFTASKDARSSDQQR